jgi:hypothetical protein
VSLPDHHVAIAAFIAGHAAAWQRGEVEDIADALGLPQMVAHGTGTTFIEDDGQQDEWIDDRLARWAAHGIAQVTAAVEAIEELPDEAARVTSRWQLTDAAGAEVASFTAVDTLAADEGEWYYVVTDTAGEDAVWDGVN